MLKETAAIAGAAVILSPIGIPLASCGLPGLLIAGAGLFVADAFLKEVNGAINKADGESPAAPRREDEERERS